MRIANTKILRMDIHRLRCWIEYMGEKYLIYIALAGAVLCCSAGESLAVTPPSTGVYGCYDPYTQYQPSMMFGLLDSSSYSDYDGNIGEYSYDARTGVLTMTSGGLRGARYLRDGDQVFRVLDADGSVTGNNCPLEPAKDVRKHPW